MMCKLCRKHNQRPQKVRQGCAVWVDVPCFNYKRESLQEHEKTNNHSIAVYSMEVQLGLTAVDGGIEDLYYFPGFSQSESPPGLPKILGRTLPMNAREFLQLT